MHERVGRQPLPLFQCEASAGDGVEYVAVTGRIDDHRNRRVVLRRGAHHRRTADVDLLDALVRRGTGCDRLGERIQVDHDQVERADVQLVELFHVIGLAPVRKDAGMHPRVQRLDPAVQAFGEPGDLLDRGNRNSRGGDPRRRGAGGYDLDAGAAQAAGELVQPALVEDADEGAADG